MDPATITALIASVFALLQPYLPMIAEKAAEKFGEEIPASVGKVWTAIKSRFENKPAAKEALDDLQKLPEKTDYQASFRVQLEKLLEQDAAFADELKSLADRAQAETKLRTRDGAIAYGDHARAVGKGGMLIDGSVGGDALGPGAKKTGK